MEKRVSTKLSAYIFFLLSYIISGSVLFNVNTNWSYVRFLALPLFCVIVISIIRINKIQFSDMIFIIWSLLFIFTVIQRLKGGFGEGFGLFSAMIYGAYISRRFEIGKVKTVFIKAIIVITAFSLVGYIINNYFVSLNSLLPKYTNSNNVTFAFGLVYNYILNEPIRNCGAFWEPGIFASWIEFALVLILFDKENKTKKIGIIILILGVLSTYSAAGYLVLLILLALYLMNISDKIKNGRTRVISRLCIILASIVICFVLYPLLVQNFENDYYLGSLFGESFWQSSRIYSIVQNWELFIQNPLIGFGQSYVEGHIVNVGNTASSVFMLASYGILGAFYTIALVIGVLRQRRLSAFNKCVVLLILLAIVNKEPHYEFAWTWILTFSLLKKDDLLEDKTRSMTSNGGRGDNDEKNMA